MGKSNIVVVKAVDRKDFPSEDSLSKVNFREARYLDTAVTLDELNGLLEGEYAKDTVLIFWDQNKMQITEEQAKELLQLNSI